MFVKSRARIVKMNAFRAKVMDETRLCIAAAGGWVERPANWQRALQEAASNLGMAYSRIFNLWYGRAVPWADELEAMKARKSALDQRITGLEQRHEKIREARALARRQDADFGRMARGAVGTGARGSEATEAARLSRAETNARPAVPADD